MWSLWHPGKKIKGMVLEKYKQVIWYNLSIAWIFFIFSFFLFISQNKCATVPNSESYDLLLYILLYVTNIIALPQLPIS